MSEKMDLVCCLFLLLSIANSFEISGTTANVDRELIFEITGTRLDVHPPSNLQPPSEATHFLSDTPDQQQLATRSPLKAVTTLAKAVSRKLTGRPRRGRRSTSRGGSFVSGASFGRQYSSGDVGSSSRRDGAVRRSPKRYLSHSEKYGQPGGYKKQMVHYGEDDIPSPQRQLENGPSEAELRKRFGTEGGYPKAMVQYDDKRSK